MLYSTATGVDADHHNNFRHKTNIRAKKFHEVVCVQKYFYTKKSLLQ